MGYENRALHTLFFRSKNLVDDKKSIRIFHSSCAVINIKAIMTTDQSTVVSFRDPFTSLKGGYDIHVYFNTNQHAFAVAIYNAFLSYLTLHNIRPTYSFVYDTPPDFEGGPHKGPMWVVQLMGINPVRDVFQEGGNEQAVHQLGIAIAWIMLNRHGLKVFVHPNVAMPFGDAEQEKIDHDDYAVWMGAADPIPNTLDIGFFDRLLAKDASQAQRESVQRRKKATTTPNAI